MRKPCGLMVLRSLLQLGVVLGVDAHGVKVARSLAMAWWSVCALMPFLLWLIMARSCSDRCEGVAVGLVCLLVA